MAFKARLNFSGTNNYGLYRTYVLNQFAFPLKKKGLTCLLFISIWGCGPTQSEQKEIDAAASVASVDSLTSKVQEPSPPESFILDLKTAANTIILVQLTKVDSVTGTTKIFSGSVLKSYKGILSKGNTISYAGSSEKIYKKDLADTVVVFLTKHQNPLSNISRKNIYYSTVEDNAMVEPYLSLDSLLNP